MHSKAKHNYILSIEGQSIEGSGITFYTQLKSLDGSDDSGIANVKCKA